jgi:hypothetical protein
MTIIKYLSYSAVAITCLGMIIAQRSVIALLQDIREDIHIMRVDCEHACDDRPEYEILHWTEHKELE